MECIGVCMTVLIQHDNLGGASRLMWIDQVIRLSTVELNPQAWIGEHRCVIGEGMISPSAWSMLTTLVFHIIWWKVWFIGDTNVISKPRMISGYRGRQCWNISAIS